ncbi:MAG: tRNA dimethylallyltransferase [Bacteroidetes bacterium ADurb.BinA245]|nr:MAG: tRNA dimethylallyltransferase [Bacteroidetes bacterium ADurb.BinA245]HMW67747.1 tRNA (adenosine(37)-N6)-dimethylallyltransferase MiaA [Chitinophagaceae bacterium]HNA97635.1 tRNA (adenosine(37)-N6)-dimethylallyltransferase MiaA [Chitinophagaceae bacterium]HNJ26784.1 tRNA (adenosine(37)-N6)-dimethylallyltransferase MiaA [Chitinophagaceae bacterium]HNJ56442.1 tRNA (adenosine(37)-N6)-dimethylallyltransferase MiaA [Chitinophagaceae bacterium]
MNVSQNKTAIIICGPTAVGKTAVAIQIAKHLGTEIISADSRQCFKELNIGVARPTEKELQTVPHHFMASHSVNEEVTAVGFEQYALEKIEFLFKKNNVVVLVGGTGLYIKAFEDGLDLIPEINVNIRREIVTNYENLGINWLQQELREKDPVFFKEGEIQNPQRMMRALEVINATGQSILSFRKGKKANRDFKIIKIGLELPKEILHLRIQERVDKMMEQGLLDEVKNMIPYRKRNALQTVGYAELFDYLEGKTELKLAVELIKTHTRQYAKRQMTWFKKDKNIQWFGPNELNAMLTYVKPIL